MRKAPRPKLEQLWIVLQRAGKPIPASDLADIIDASHAYTRRVLGAWAAGGFVRRDGLGGYQIGQNTPIDPPMIRHHYNGGEAVDVTPAMTGAEFAKIRKDKGYSVIGMARALGWQGHRVTMSKNIRAYERGKRPIDQSLADKARKLKQTTVS